MSDQVAQASAPAWVRKLRRTWGSVKKMRYYYLLLIPTIAFFIIFHYIPMYGVTLAFKDFKFSAGIIGSPGVGLMHFERLFTSPSFWEILRNTLVISFLRLIFGFPAPILFAILINEIINLTMKKTLQTISYLPHFISWVVMGGIIIEMLSPSHGAVNWLVTKFGGEPIYFLTIPEYFRGILVITGIYKSVGWGSIIYLAAISGIDVEQYDSAYMDGATRFHMIRYIILPSLAHVIVIIFILNLGQILNAGFDQVFNLYNPMVYSVGDIIDTYVYRIGLLQMQYSFSTAVGLFKNVVGFALVITVNYISKRIGDSGYGLF